MNELLINPEIDAIAEYKLADAPASGTGQTEIDPNLSHREQQELRSGNSGHFHFHLEPELASLLVELAIRGGAASREEEAWTDRIRRDLLKRHVLLAEHEVNPSLSVKISYRARKTGEDIFPRSIDVRKTPGLARLFVRLMRDRDAFAEILPSLSAESLKLLIANNVVVRRDELPQKTRGYRCPLLDAPMPRASRLEGRTLHSGVLLQESSDVPAMVAAEAPGSGPLGLKLPVLWIKDGGTGIWAPYELDGEVLASVRHVLLGKTTLDSLDPKLKGALEQAGALACKGELPWTRSDSSLQTQKYLILRRLIPSMHLKYLTRYIEEKRQEGRFELDLEHVAEGRTTLHNDPVAQFFQAQAARVVSSLSGEKNEPSFTFFMIYFRGAVLRRHVDRKQCAWNMSVQISQGAKPWPFYFEVEGKPHEILLAPGDAVLYSGTRIPHWRDALDEESQTIMTLHFVDASFAGNRN
jgi:hypothetical protein